MLFYICNKYSWKYSFWNCGSSSIEDISHSVTAGFNVRVAYILLNISKFPIEEIFPWYWMRGFVSHALTNTWRLKHPFIFALLIGEIELMFSCIQYFRLMFIGCFSFFWSCLFMSFLDLNFKKKIFLLAYKLLYNVVLFSFLLYSK